MNRLKLIIAMLPLVLPVALIPIPAEAAITPVLCPPGHYVVFVLGTASDGLGSEFDDIKRGLVDRSDQRCATQFVGFSYDDAYVVRYADTLAPGANASATELLEPLSSYGSVARLQGKLGGPGAVELLLGDVSEPRFYRQCRANPERGIAFVEQAAPGLNPCGDRRSTRIAPETTSSYLDRLLSDLNTRERAAGRVATFDLVGHSLGGYLLTYWATTRFCATQDCARLRPVETRQLRHIIAIEAPIMGRPWSFLGGLCGFSGTVFETAGWLNDGLLRELFATLLGPEFADVAVEVVDVATLVVSPEEFVAQEAREKALKAGENVSAMCRDQVAEWLDPLSDQTLRILHSDVENRVPLAIVRSRDDQVVLSDHATLVPTGQLCDLIGGFVNWARSFITGSSSCIRGDGLGPEPTGIPPWRDFEYPGGFDRYDPRTQVRSECPLLPQAVAAVVVSPLVAQRLGCFFESHQVFPEGADAAVNFLSQRYVGVGRTVSFYRQADSFASRAPGCSLTWIPGGACLELPERPTVRVGQRLGE